VLIRQVTRIVLAAAIASVSLSPASSRVWKTTPQGLARDYAGIVDTRTGETVSIMWFVPQMVQANAAALKAMTEKYVVLVVTHSKVDKLTGLNSYEDFSALEPKDQTGKALTPVVKENLPPTSAALLAGFEASFRQSSKGAKIFVFDRGDVDSCKQGQLSVSVAGENYTWETPFPGCSSGDGRERSADRT
jgi:hypothetical protein